MKVPEARKRWTVLIAEDEGITRFGLRLMIEESRDFRIVGEAADGEVALQLTDRLKPDVLLLDVMLPKVLGFTVARKVKETSPDTRIIFLSSNETPEFLEEAQAAGGSGYVSKASLPSSLLDGMRHVRTSIAFFVPAATPPVRNSEARQSDLPSPHDLLTGQEHLVLRMAAKGATSAEIAYDLGLSTRTVDTHRANLMRKLKLHSQTDLVLFALKTGILKIEK